MPHHLILIYSVSCMLYIPAAAMSVNISLSHMVVVPLHAVASTYFRQVCSSLRDFCDTVKVLLGTLLFLPGEQAAALGAIPEAEYIKKQRCLLADCALSVADITAVALR